MAIKAKKKTSVKSSVVGVASKVLKRKTTDDTKLAGLKKWNLVVAGIYLVQGIAILVLGKTYVLSVTTSYVTSDALASQNGSTVLASALRNLFDVNVAYLVAALLFVATIVHLVVATIYRKQYEKGLKDGVNKIRWIDYGVVGSLSMVILAMFAGIYDLSTLFMAVALVLIAATLGYVTEVQSQKSKSPSWLTYLLGVKAIVVPWIVLGIYVWGACVFGDGKLSVFVYWLLGSAVLLFAGLALVMYARYKNIGKWADSVLSEQASMALGFVLVTAIAWQVFFGVLR